MIDSLKNTDTKSSFTYLIIILSALSGMAPICTDLYLPALPQMSEALKTNPSLAQMSLTASMLGIALGQTFLGPLSDMKGRKVILIISLIAFIASSLLCAISQSIGFLITVRFIQGLAGSGAVVLSRTIICDIFTGNNLTKYIALLMLIGGVAPIISPVLGGQILRFTDWRGIFIFLMIIGCVLLVSSIPIVKETLPPQKRNASGLRSAMGMLCTLFKNKGFMKYCWINATMHIILFGYIAASPFVFQKVYHLDPAHFSYCFALSSISGVAGAQISSKLSKLLGEQKVLVLALGFLIPSSIAVLVFAWIKVESAWLFLAPVLLMMCCFSAGSVTSFSLAIQRQTGAAGSASGLLGVLAFLFGAIASPLVGLGGEHTAVPLGITVVGATILALILVQLKETPTKA